MQEIKDNLGFWTSFDPEINFKKADEPHIGEKKKTFKKKFKFEMQLPCTSETSRDT